MNGNMIDPNAGGFMGMLSNPMLQAGLAIMASNTRSRQHGQGGRAVMNGLGAFNQAQRWQMQQQQAQIQMQKLQQQMMSDAERKKWLAIMNDPSAPEELRNEAMRNAYPDQFAQSQFASQKPTSLQSNYEYQQQLPPDQQQQFGELMQRPTTTVNVGTAGPKPEAGMTIVPDPQAPSGYRAIPVTGSKEDLSRKEGIRELKTGLDTTKKMISLIETHGSEAGTLLSGTESQQTSGKMKAMHAELVTLVSQLSSLGVLDKGEREYMNEVLVDPSSYASYFVSNDKILAGYDYLQKRIEQAIQSRADIGQIDPGIEQAPSQQAPEPGMIEVSPQTYELMQKYQ